MKINLSIFLFWGVLLLVMSTQGVLLFNIFKPLGAWELKSAVQPMGILLIFGYFIASRMHNPIKITEVDIMLFSYFGIMGILLLVQAAGAESVYLGFREVFLIFILIFLFNQFSLSEKQWKWILFIVFALTIANLIFSFLIYMIGLERYMIMLTGEFFWGNHPEYKFKISNFVGAKLYRVPALVGEAATLGHFGAFSFFLLKDRKGYKKLAYLGLVLVAFSFIRSVYVLVLIYFFLLGVSTSKRMVRFVLYSLPVVPVLLFFLMKYNLLDLQSMMMRLSFWQTKISVNYNYLFGGAIGEVGKATITGGFEDTIDNYWLFLLFSTGFIGIFLALTFLYEKSRYKRDLLFIVIATCVSGFFVTLTQSMAILVMLPLLFMNYNDLARQNG